MKSLFLSAFLLFVFLLSGCTSEPVTEEHRAISSLESEVEAYVQTLFSYGGTSTTGLQNYWQEIYQLIASGTALEEIDEVPYFQGMSVNFMNKESVYDLPSYHIGRWYLVLCGVGGGAFSPRGNSCTIGRNRFSQKIQGLEVDWMVSFNGVILAKEGQWQYWKLWFFVDDTYSNSPKALFVRDGKLLLVSLNGNGGGSGEGFLSIYTLQENGTWEITDCRYYTPWRCSEEEIEKNADCISPPKLIERFDQQPLMACIDYDNVVR